MVTPSEDASDRVDLGKHAEPQAPPSDTGGEHEPPFDPYRYGAPDVPPPPEYAPPGYVPPPGYTYPPQAPPTAPPAAPPTAAYPPYPYGPGSQPGASPSPYGAPSYGQPPHDPAPYGPAPYGPASYGPSPYGPAPYGPLHADGGGGNGKAVAGMVLGIVSIVLFWLTFFDAIFVLLGLIFSLLGLNDAGRRGGRGRGQAVAGLICTAIGAVAAIVFTIFVVHVINKCGGFSSQGDPGYQQCVRDHV